MTRDGTCSPPPSLYYLVCGKHWYLSPAHFNQTYACSEATCCMYTHTHTHTHTHLHSTFNPTGLNECVRDDVYTHKLRLYIHIYVYTVYICIYIYTVCILYIYILYIYTVYIYSMYIYIYIQYMYIYWRHLRYLRHTHSVCVDRSGCPGLYLWLCVCARDTFTE